MAEPLTVAVIAFGAALTSYNNGPFPGNRTFARSPRVEQLYKDGGRQVAMPILNPESADRACPSGYEIRRQETRTDGSKVYLVWTLACR